MAEKLMNIINFHSSGNVAPDAALLLEGEIAVVHPNKDEAALYTKVSDGEVAKFMSENSVKSEITKNVNSILEIIGNPSEEAPSEDEEGTDASGLYAIIETLQNKITELEGKVASLETSDEETYKVKGSVATYEALLAIENPKKGDAYNVEEYGANYVYNGTSWDSMANDAEDEETVSNNIADIFS